MGNKTIKVTRDMNWREIMGIYIQVLKYGWSIRLDLVRDNGTYIIALNERTIVAREDLDFLFGSPTPMLFKILTPVIEGEHE